MQGAGPQRVGGVVFWKWRRLWGQPCLGRAWESDGMCIISESSSLEQLSVVGALSCMSGFPPTASTQGKQPLRQDLLEEPCAPA